MQTLQFGLFQVKDLLCFFQCISIIRHDILIKSSSADLLKELPGGVLILYQGFTNVAIRIKSNKKFVFLVVSLIALSNTMMVLLSP